MKIEIYKAFSSELEHQWRDFERKSIWSPFQAFGWLSLWYDVVGKPLHNIEPQIFVIKENEIVIAIFPTSIRRKAGISIMEWMGGIHADYMGPLLHDEFNCYVPDFNNLWQEIMKLMKPVDIIHMRRQPVTINNVKNPFILYFDVVHNESAFMVDLFSSWDDFYSKKIKKKLRADSSRQRLRLEKHGVLNFKVAESVSEKQNIIHNMIEQKSQQYRNIGISDMLAIDQHREFYSKLADSDFGSYNLTCSALMIDDKIIATHVGLMNNDIFYYMMPSNLCDDWQVYSPGRLLLEFLLKLSIERNIKTFDFTVGSEQYKKNWCDIEIKLFEYIHPISFAGKCYSACHKVMALIHDNPHLWKSAVTIRHSMRKFKYRKGISLIFKKK